MPVASQFKDTSEAPLELKIFLEERSGIGNVQVMMSQTNSMTKVSTDSDGRSAGIDMDGLKYPTECISVIYIRSCTIDNSALPYLQKRGIKFLFIVFSCGSEGPKSPSQMVINKQLRWVFILSNASAKVNFPDSTNIKCLP